MLKWNYFKIYLLTILFCGFFSDCKLKRNPLQFFGSVPILNKEKIIIIENHQNLFTNELGKTANFTVRLSLEPDYDVVLGPIESLNSKEGMITSSSYITFTRDNFDIPQSITVAGMADWIIDGNKSYNISLGKVTTNDYSYSLLTTPQVSVINTDHESASFAVSPSIGLNTNESGTSTSFSVVLSSQPGADVVIPSFASDKPTECSVSGSLTFTPQNWDIPQSVTVTGVDDNFVDGPITCFISSSPSTSTDSVYANKTIPLVSVINVDNDSSGFTIVPITDAFTTESGGQARFSMVMNSRPNGDVAISGITTSDSTEATISPTSVTFNSTNWNTPAVFTLTGLDDLMQDGDISYNVIFSNAVASAALDPTYNGLAVPSAGSFTNRDNDTRGVTIAPLAPTASVSPLTISESGPAQRFQVKLNSIPCNTPSNLSNCSPGSVTIQLTNNHTDQFTISPTSLTFSPTDWDTFQTVTVTPIEELIDDGNLDLTLSLDPITGGTDYNGFDPADVTVRIMNNDTAGFTVSPAGGITVNENDPGGIGLEATITVVLNTQPTANVTIGPVISTDNLELVVVSTLGGGNTGISNRRLVFTPTAGQAIVNSDTDGDSHNDTSTGGWNVPQTVRVRAVVDGTLDGTKIRAINFGARSSTDLRYGNSTNTPIPDIVATNEDSGAPTIMLQSISAFNFNEDGTSTITFQVVLATLPTSNVTIANITSSDTTEGVVLPNGGGAPIGNRTLVFTSATNTAPTGTNTTTGGWNVPQTVTIRSVVDDFDDGNINFTINFPVATGGADYNGKRPTSASGFYNGTTGTLTLTNIDNDTKGFTITPNTITSSGTPLSVTEGNAAGTSFTVALSSNPCNTPGNLSTCAAGAVNINLTNNNTSQYTVSPSSLSFTAGNWNVAQTVTVVAVNDRIDENAMDFTLVLEPISGSGTDYDGLNPDDIAIQVQDNDTRAINLTLSTGFSHVTSSGGGYTEYRLNLGSRPALGNTVSVVVSVPTTAPQEAKILDADNTTELDTRTFSFTNANWNVNQIFRVKGLAGSGAGSTSFTLTRTASETGTFPPSGYSGGQYNDYNGVTANQSITNYHIGAGKKIRVVGTSTTLNESDSTPASFWVLLSQAPVADVTLNFGIDSAFPCTLPASVGSTTQFTVTSGAMVLNASNWNQISDTNRVQITRVDDSVDDGNVTCDLKITSVSSTDPFYSGLTNTDFNVPTITINDNDSSGIDKQVVPLSSGRLITSRSGASGTIQYRLLSRPMTDVVLNFSISPNLATANVANLTFTPANYNSFQTVTFTGNTNGTTADENYVITATASSTESNTGFSGAGIYNTMTDTQNATNRFLLYDLVPCTTASTASCSAANGSGGTVAGTYTTTEAGGQRFFAIRLRARPNATVSIPISSSNTAEGTVSSSSLNFLPAVWETFQIVTITGVNDFLVDGSVNYTIDFGAMTGDASFTTTIAALNASNSDNDVAGFTLTNANDTGIPEANLGRSFSVRLNSQPTANVSIPLSVNTPTAPDTGLTITSATTLVFTPANWNTPQNVNFTWTADGVTSPAMRNHTVILGTATSTDGNYAVNPPDYTISIDNSNP